MLIATSSRSDNVVSTLTTCVVRLSHVYGKG
jgi:hypothetical protein